MIDIVPPADLAAMPRAPEDAAGRPPRAVSVLTETAGREIGMGTQCDSAFPRFNDREKRSRAVSVLTETAGREIGMGTQCDSAFPRVDDREKRSRAVCAPTEPAGLGCCLGPARGKVPGREIDAGRQRERAVHRADGRWRRSGVEWWVDDAPVDYPDAVARMEARVEAIRHGEAGDTMWLLDHPPLYTAGTSARPRDLLSPDRFPVYKSGRGGQYTYHGPGQRIAYAMLDLRTRGKDLRRFVHHLENWVIGALAIFNLRGERRDGRVGIWIDRGYDDRADKIAALGVRVRHWVSFHGVSINVEPDLDHFGGIVPCGIETGRLGVTSLVDLGLPATTADLDVALMSTWADHLSPEAFEKRART